MSGTTGLSSDMESRKQARNNPQMTALRSLKSYASPVFG